VVKLDINSHTVPKVIDLDIRTAFCDRNRDKVCMDFEVCLKYTGKALPAALSNINFNIYLSMTLN
jgi:hypothetical protein